MKTRKGNVNENMEQANAKVRYEVDIKNTPLSCPMPEMYVWNSHPKVFLPIEETGEAKCPYCGAEFYLKNKS